MYIYILKYVYIYIYIYIYIGIPVNWTTKNLPDCVGQTMRAVWQLTHENPMPDSSFAYCFPLIEHVLMQPAGGKNSAVLEDALVCLNAHASLGVCFFFFFFFLTYSKVGSFPNREERLL